MTSSSLTDPAWWDAFWAGVRIPEAVNTSIQWQAALAGVLRRELPPARGRRLLEIGCAPGRWLVWFAQELGYTVAGSESSPRGFDLTRENLDAHGCEATLYFGDVLGESLPREAFDVVLSLGLIEHFDDPLAVVARHRDLVSPGGTVVVEVPNLAGLVNLRLLRALEMDEFVARHNLEVMSIAALRTIARRLDLEPQRIAYVGGFDPTLMLANRATGGLGDDSRLVRALYRIRGLEAGAPRLARALNARWWSHMLVAVLRAPA